MTTGYSLSGRDKVQRNKCPKRAREAVFRMGTPLQLERWSPTRTGGWKRRGGGGEEEGREEEGARKGKLMYLYARRSGESNPPPPSAGQGSKRGSRERWARTMSERDQALLTECRVELEPVDTGLDREVDTGMISSMIEDLVRMFSSVGKPSTTQRCLRAPILVTVRHLRTATPHDETGRHLLQLANDASGTGRRSMQVKPSTDAGAATMTDTVKPDLCEPARPSSHSSSVFPFALLSRHRPSTITTTVSFVQ